MIVNERQYSTALKQVERFEQAVDQARESTPRPGLDPAIHAALIDGIQGELQDLRKQVRRYEQVKNGSVKTRKLRRLAELPEALIEARIARNWSHKDLAARLGLAEQQIQRYEQQRYAKTSLDRLVRISDALGITLKPEVGFSSAPAKPGTVTRRGRKSTSKPVRAAKRS